jgi:uncharacterized protein (TIGR02246 family)
MTDSQTAAAQIRQTMDEWRRLTEDQDVDGLLALTADDVVFLTPGNPPTGKKEFAAGLRAVFAKASIAPAQDIREIRTAGDVAYAWSQLSVDLIPKDGGPKVRNQGYTLTVFRRAPAGGWQIARDANLMMGAGNPDRV